MTADAVCFKPLAPDDLDVMIFGVMERSVKRGASVTTSLHLPPRYTSTYRRSEATQLGVTSGSMMVAVDGESYGMGPGDRLYIPGSMEFSFTTGDEGVECFDAQYPIGRSTGDGSPSFGLSDS